MKTPAPQGLVAKVKLGRGTGGLARYVVNKPGARILSSTWAAGADARGWAREAHALAELSPRLAARRVVHASLSAAPGVVVTDEQWRNAASAWLSFMGLDGHPHAVVQHRDTQHAHVHLVVASVSPATRRCWRDGQSYKRNMEAAAAAARAASIPSPQARPGLTPAPGSGAHRSVRRERRRKTADLVLTPRELADRLRSVVAQAHSFDTLAAAAPPHGLEVQVLRQSTGRVTGLLVRQTGAEGWLKASSLARDCSSSALAKRWATQAPATPVSTDPDPAGACTGLSHERTTMSQPSVELDGGANPLHLLKHSLAEATDQQLRDARTLARHQFLVRDRQAPVSLPEDWQPERAAAGFGLLRTLIALLVRVLTLGLVRPDLSPWPARPGDLSQQASARLLQVVDNELAERALRRAGGVQQLERMLEARRSELLTLDDRQVKLEADLSATAMGSLFSPAVECAARQRLQAELKRVKTQRAELAATLEEAVRLLPLAAQIQARRIEQEQQPHGPQPQTQPVDTEASRHRGGG